MVEKKESTKKTAKNAEKASPPPKEYIFAVGRRKTAQSRVKFFTDGSGNFEVNGRAFEHYFPSLAMQKIVIAPLETMGIEKKVDAMISVQGGGVVAQADATRLAFARALVKANSDNKTVLKKAGFMTRDAREKERKKPGLKRARRAPQWQKR